LRKATVRDSWSRVQTADAPSGRGERRGRDGDPGDPAEPDAAGHGGAEPHRLRRTGETHPHLKGSRHRVRLGRDLADPAGGADIGVGAQCNGHLVIGGGRLDHPRRHVEDRIASALAGKLDDHASGRNNLARLRAAGGDDARTVGDQGRESKLILGRADLGLGRLHLRPSGVACLDGAVELGAGDEAPWQQRLVPLHRIARLDQTCHGGGQIRPRRVDRIALVDRVESGDDLPRANLIADADGALDQLSADPKGQGHVILRLHVAGEGHGLAARQLLDRHDPHRTDGLGDGLRLFDRLASGEQREDRRKHEGTVQGCAGPADQARLVAARE
jgi:hypothetical protein